jgi:hypothetical protein
MELQAIKTSNFNPMASVSGNNFDGMSKFYD